MRYEGFGTEASKDFWMNLCAKDVYPVGWCAANGKPLVPPKCIEHKYVDWKEFLVKRLTGARTLPQDFYYTVQEELRDIPIRKGMRLEIVDKMCVSALRVAAAEEVIGGRLMLRYDNSHYDNDTFWCHHASPLLHYVGWSETVGHKITVTQEYNDKVKEKLLTNMYDKQDVQIHMLPKPAPFISDTGFSVGMKLEAIDPLNLSTICVATVKKVLLDNYLMVGIDGSMAQNGTDWFCYHASSPSIFPVGFCEINGLKLTPPKSYKVVEFKWFEYLQYCKAVAAPVKLFDKEIPKHGYRKGMKLEAVDLMDPRLICVGTIVKVVGRLLCIHFDGWDETYDQWLDCQSPDIYPIGWCEMVGYYLEGPRSQEQSLLKHTQQSKVKVAPKRRRAKSQVYRGPRKKRKSKVPPAAGTVMGGTTTTVKLEPQSSFDMSETSMDGYTEIKLEDDVKASPSSSSNFPTSSTTPTLPVQAPRDVAQSALSSSVPAIATMLNSPPRCLPSPPLPSPPLPSPTASSTGGGPTASGSPTITASGGPTITASGRKSGLNQVTLHHIPRVAIGESGDGSGPLTVGTGQPVTPITWSVFDVCQFLRINDCGQHCDTFRKKNIDGAKLLELSKEQIVNLTGMKVGPSLKIHDLIQALKRHVSSPGKQQQPQPASISMTASQIIAQAKRAAAASGTGGK